jgi:hypothetical protein
MQNGTLLQQVNAKSFSLGILFVLPIGFYEKNRLVFGLSWFRLFTHMSLILEQFGNSWKRE